jgi:hypothetical protein
MTEGSDEGAAMVTLRIEHAITDYGTWKKAFDGFDEARRGGGVLGHRILRPPGDDRYVFVELDLDSAEAATRFLDFLTTRVWSTPANAPALAGEPRTRILELVERS